MPGKRVEQQGAKLGPGCKIDCARVNVINADEATHKYRILKSGGHYADDDNSARHTLNKGEKAAYLGAELCLMQKKATVGLPVSRTKFDELQENHQIQANVVHQVGAFLPYHRYLMWAHEHLLRTECGYKGAQPYWYEQMDAGKFSKSKLFDAKLGFGGDGRAKDHCITTGLFKDYENVIGPGFENTKHCIDREISDEASEMVAQQFVDRCDRYNTYEKARPCIEGAPHAGGHGGVGRQMSNAISSPGDPLFYLHHTWLDKVWWDWQTKNITSRLYDMSGPNTQPRNCWPRPPPGEECPEDLFPQPPAHIQNMQTVDGDPGKETTLNHVLNMMGIIRNVTIEKVMDIRNEILCYEYVEPDEEVHQQQEEDEEDEGQDA
ncbi:hypothetical protein FQN57_001345 [Myotisia sp. PD_48]|nr:hypothetical protein FQN57_001345 [Myotisia sp. PD_48]